MKIFSLRLPDDLIEKIRSYAEKHRQKIWAVVANALDDFFKRNK